MHIRWARNCLGIAEKIGSRFPLSQRALVVHSIYTSTINLQDADGTIYSIVSKKIACHPSSILLCNTEFFSLMDTAQLQIGSPVSVQKEGLFFSCGLWVSFLGAKRVHPSEESAPQSFLVDTPVIRKRMELLDSIQKKKGTDFQIFYQQRTVPNGRLSYHRFYQSIENLSKSILNQTVLDSLDSIQSILGLGAGATPAGDDFLCGLMLSWHMKLDTESSYLNFNSVVIKKIKALLLDNNQITTDISRMFLLLACDGLFSDSLLTLAQSWAPTESDDKYYLFALTSLSEIGHSSGLDAAYGMVYGFSHHLMHVA